MGKYWTTFLLVTIFSTVESQDRIQYCKTHENKPGSCVRMRNCETLIQLTKEFKNKLDASKFLRKSECGIDKFGPLFCCPSQINRNTKRMVFNVIEASRDPEQPIDNSNSGRSIDVSASTGNSVPTAESAFSTSGSQPIFVEQWYVSRVGMINPRLNQSVAFRSDHPSIGIRCFYHPNLLYPFQITGKNYNCVCYRISPPAKPPVTPTTDGSFSSSTTDSTENPNSSTLSKTTEETISPETTEKPTTSSTTTQNLFFPTISITTEKPISFETPYPSITNEIPYPSKTTDMADNSSTKKPFFWPNLTTKTTENHSSATSEMPSFSRATEELNSATTEMGSFKTSTTPKPSTEEPFGFYRNFLPTPPNCGRSKIITTKVVGGAPSTIGRWPWMVVLGYKLTRGTNDKLSWSCGGALITHRHILTAAHCLDAYTPGYILHTARMGVVDLDTNAKHKVVPVDILVDSKIAHEEYVNHVPNLHDIAIVTLKTPAEFDDYIQPICLPISSDWENELFVGKRPFVAGWGQLESGVEMKSKKLMEVQTPVVSYEKCKNAYKAEFNLSQQQLCAGSEGKDSCQGDSGGPLMLSQNGSYFVIGIVSFGRGCASPGFPGIYTRITAYMHWIKDKLITF